VSATVPTSGAEASAISGGRPLLAVNNVEVVYGVSLAVRGVSFEVPEGGVVALLGPNGAGKTSVIRAVSGLLGLHNGSIRDGEIELDGTSIRGLAADAIVARGVGQVPEGRLVFRQLTVEENLRVGATAHKGGTVGESLDQVYELFPVLRERRRQKAGWLSGGEQQMVAVARALSGNVKLLLLDEPFEGLAPAVTLELFGVFDRLRRDIGIVVVEHNLDLVLALADRVFALERGAVFHQGPAQPLLTDLDYRKKILWL
jgi:branched-chain amino acid transport system ATP-binding protein